ncbi:MAG: UxaA family hydrolase [Christensenellales bacterium]|jgi:altronate hydrolase
MADWIKIDPDDNVAVALSPMDAGAAIPRGHKFAVAPIAAGDRVIKYGHPIGEAICDIRPGDWVHTHNLKTALTEGAAHHYSPQARALTPREPASFLGYPRADGRAGVRNEIWILPTVGCVNDVCRRLAQAHDEFARACGLGGVFAFPHPYGCSQLGEDADATRDILAALARHPNAGGVLLVGLGCENNTMDHMRAALEGADTARIQFLVCQEEADELSAGGARIRGLIDVAQRDRRAPLPASRLVVGLKCGGSDGLSGITANPVVGAFSDRLIAMGGSAILTEVPEMFGAEDVLLRRCPSREMFDKAARMIADCKAYYVRHGQPVHENPSPGNKEGGITTLEEKSLGCVQKGGSAPVSDVLEYAQTVRRRGLTLLAGPGNDLVSTTALTAAGAQIILFTTGRGTPFGAPAVTLKIASNRALAQHKANWIDFDAGTVAEGEPIPAAADRLMEFVLHIASGDGLSKCEINGYREIAIFKNGVTL